MAKVTKPKSESSIEAGAESTAGSELLDDLDHPSTTDNATAPEPLPITSQVAELAKAWAPAKKKPKSGQPCNQPDCPGAFRTLTSGFIKPKGPRGRKTPYTRLICDTCKHKETA